MEPISSGCCSWHSPRWLFSHFRFIARSPLSPRQSLLAVCAALGIAYAFAEIRGQSLHASARDGQCRPFPERLAQLDRVIAAWPLDRYVRAKRRDTEALFVFLQELAPGKELCMTFGSGH